MYNCDKCNKEIVTANEELVEAKCLKYIDEDKEYFVIRCDECFAKDQSLTNYRKIETYSRVVGYIRPVQSWNKGKQEEYEDRVVFNSPEEKTATDSLPKT